MSLISDMTNGINNAVNAAQDYIDNAVDTVQTAAQTATDGAQAAANAGVDAMQDGLTVAASVYDNLLGTNVFGQVAETANRVIDVDQNLANIAVDAAQDAADALVDATQFIHRDTVDLLQYAATLYPKLLDDLLGDGSVTMPAVPASAQALEDAVRNA